MQEFAVLDCEPTPDWRTVWITILSACGAHRKLDGGAACSEICQWSPPKLARWNGMAISQVPSR